MADKSLDDLDVAWYNSGVSPNNNNISSIF